ncbi:MAG: hypothetical protein U9R25_08470 [Chloroflexota bacterium]|nr:hypothetical protein [Chloroflexota bacterium]
MARTVDSGTSTPADQLRDLLDRCEHRVVSPMDGGGVPELFQWMDQIADSWSELEAIGVDLRAEKTRWQGLQSKVQTRGSILLRAWPDEPSLAEVRAAVKPGQDRSWWWIDEYVAASRRSRLIRSLAILAAVAAVIGGGIFLFEKLFPVDPIVKQVYELRSQAELAMFDGDLEAARQAFAEAVAVDPTDIDLRLMFGAIQESLGEQADADESWRVALDLLDGDEAAFYVQRASAFGKVGQADKALEDAQAAVELDPESAEAFMIMGIAYELASMDFEALQAYQIANELVDDGNAQLTVLIRTRMASLLQRPASAPPTEAPP